MEKLDTFRQIIDLWTRRDGFAAEIGITAGRASVWWQRDIIQPEFFSEVAAGCARKGHPEITIERLNAIYTAKKRGAA
jgi:hypothetical protein